MKTFNEFQEEMIDEVLDEKVVKREKRTAQQRRDQKMVYRKNRNKLKMAAKKYRKTAGYKQLQKKAKRMRKMGKTATGRDISVRGGSGSEKRLSKMKKDIRK
tara:strand:+ start:407 stop:712 length:306 start_codon:yes stop_codon:yes gene_type:complete